MTGSINIHFECFSNKPFAAARKKRRPLKSCVSRVILGRPLIMTRWDEGDSNEE